MGKGNFPPKDHHNNALIFSCFPKQITPLVVVKNLKNRSVIYALIKIIRNLRPHGIQTHWPGYSDIRLIIIENDFRIPGESGESAE